MSSFDQYLSNIGWQERIVARPGGGDRAIRKRKLPAKDERRQSMIGGRRDIESISELGKIGVERRKSMIFGWGDFSVVTGFELSNEPNL